MTQTPSRALLALFAAAAVASLALPAQAVSVRDKPAASAAAEAPAPAASGPVIRREVAPQLQGAQNALKAGDNVGALAKLKEAEAVGGLTPYEVYLISRMRALAAYSAGDIPTSIKEFKSVLASDQLPAGDRLPVMEAYIRILYNEKQFPEAMVIVEQYQKLGGNNAEILELVPQMQYASNDYKGAIAAFQKQVDAEVAAGRKPTEHLLRQLATAQNGAEDEVGYGRTLRTLAELYPKQEYWQDVVSRASRAVSGLQRIEGLRLRAAITGTDGSARLQHAALALRAGYPAETKALLDEGIAKKAFTGADAAEATRTRDEAAKAVSKEKLADKGNEAAARSAPNGDALVGLGLEVFFNGETDRGIALMEAGVAKGGMKRPEEAKLHLGMALVRAGRLDDARKVLDTIQGTDGIATVAQAWSLWAKVGAKY